MTSVAVLKHSSNYPVMGVSEPQAIAARVQSGANVWEWRLSARSEGMRKMSFGLFYTEVIGQIDDD
jgi:hypothetical protein